MADLGQTPQGTLRIGQLSDVTVRLARQRERLDWDRLMNEHHYLGFKQFAGRGLRYVAEWRGQWVALAGWQTGVFQCKPRDQWLGWSKEIQFRRLHLIGNNTRFLILPAAQGCPNLGSYVLGANLKRLSADWQAEWGHPLELAESFVDPSRFQGTVYKAANWLELGQSRGFSRLNGQYKETMGQPKTMLVYPLRPDARARLRSPETPPEWPRPPRLVPYDQADLQALLELLEEVPDPRHGPALRYPLSAVLALLALAKVSGWQGGRHAEAFAQALPQKDLELLGCPFNRRAQRYEVPSDTTFQRVLLRVDPSALERVTQRWRARLARAGDGEGIRGANRLTPEGAPWKTVSLVDLASGLPVASRSYREEGGEPAAMRGLFEDVELQGITVTLDAGHTSRETIQALQDQHGAETLATIAANGGLAYDLIEREGHWVGPDVRYSSERWTPGQGHWERRELVAVPAVPDDWLPLPGVQQVFRVKHRTRKTPHNKGTTEVLYGFTSLGPDQASAQRLLQLHRGHGTVRTRDCLSRDAALGEDGSGLRTGHEPASRGARNDLALALLVRSGRGQTEAQAPGSVRREEPLAALQAKQ